MLHSPTPLSHFACDYPLLFRDCLITVSAGPASPALPSPSYIIFHVADTEEHKGNIEECHLSDSTESAGAADIVFKMMGSSSSLRDSDVYMNVGFYK